MNCLVRISFLLLSLGVALPVAAQDNSAEDAVVSKKRAKRKADRAETFRIDAIVIEGLFFTKPYVVTRELLFEEGEVTTRAEIDESIQRLRNLGIFRIAEYELLDRRVPLPDGTLVDAEEDHRILLISVDERWTVIPFGTFASAGGTFSLTTGVFDINVLGRYVELGAQYQHFAGTNSFALWGRDPRFLGERLALSGSVAQTNRVNVFYDEDGELEGGHLRFRQSASLSLNREWLNWLRSGISLGFVNDNYSYRLVPPEIIELEEQRGLPEAAHYLAVGLSAGVGRINRNSYLREGVSFGQAIQTARDGLASNLTFVDTVSQIIMFARLPLRSNLGFRAGLGTTSSERDEYQFFVGGLNLVRGYLHRRFRGSHYWYANGELRVPSIDTRWLVLQHIGFVDAAGVSDGFDAVTRLDGLSSGVGLRIISPKIFSLIARFDYAWSLIGDGRSSFSFGAGQFF